MVMPDAMLPACSLSLVIGSWWVEGGGLRLPAIVQRLWKASLKCLPWED